MHWGTHGKFVGTDAMKYYTAVKRDGALTRIAVGTNLRNVRLSKTKQTQRPRIV